MNESFTSGKTGTIERERDPGSACSHPLRLRKPWSDEEEGELGCSRVKQVKQVGPEPLQSTHSNFMAVGTQKVDKVQKNVFGSGFLSPCSLNLKRTALVTF